MVQYMLSSCLTQEANDILTTRDPTFIVENYGDVYFREINDSIGHTTPDGQRRGCAGRAFFDIFRRSRYLTNVASPSASYSLPLHL